ncbi:ninein isoform X3 [Pseudophryne corroboree]|uniref:ninein isoform X3 n=1 Tax=Pseudophryne corroboree TaxID=495146 RepID=UPI003081CBB3
MEQDQYEARLKELFDSFDATGTGSLGQEELTDLCHMLQLEEVAPSLQQALLQGNPLGRIHFDQFKEALIDALSNTLSGKESGPETDTGEAQERTEMTYMHKGGHMLRYRSTQPCLSVATSVADCSPEAQPKYIKDGKRYGRRSVPELQDSLEEFDEETVIKPEDEETRCSQLWKNEDGEEYEAEGQLRFWNPDDLSASQTVSPEQDWVEEKLQLICEDLGITRDGHLNRKKLISICEQYGFQNLGKEALEDTLQNLDHDDTMSLQDFFHEVCKNSKPLTPSSSTPYRQLKRHLSLQPYDESGRRTLTPSAMAGTVGFRLFSKLDDGTGYGSAEDIVDLWNEEGLENSPAILKALDFNLEGKINLTELTMTLENELLITKNDIYQAALISFRSEIRHLVEHTDQTFREKEKLRLDLEKNEKFKSLMASEVDDHHAAIERRNEHNLQKLDEEYKERTAALKSDLRKEREQILQQANRQRLDLEQELDKVKMEENYLRDRLTLSLKENGRMERELLETSEKLADCESLTIKLQRSLDNILREKFGDLDPSCVEFFLHEEKLLQVRNEYERQRRELQDRIDELQLELEDYRTQGVRGFRLSLKNSLFDEMDNRNSIEYDPGIGSEENPPLNMSIEAELAIEQMREQHQREVEQLTVELAEKTSHFEEKLKEAKCIFEKEQESIRQKFKDEIHKAEEQTKLFKIRHLELEADVQRMKEEQQRAECEHRDQVGKMEAEFSQQKLHLVEQEAALQVQLEEARRTYHQEKEELVQRVEDKEKEVERRLVELVTKYEEKKDQLEQILNEQLSNFQESHDVEKDILRSQLLEQHECELQEEREKMKTKSNTKISELEAQFAKDYESAVIKYEADLVGLDEKFQNDLQKLRDSLAEEKAQWMFEKNELHQEKVRIHERLEKLEEEKVMSCSELLQEKDALEKTYKELVNNLQSEKEQANIELDQLRIAAKQTQDILSGKIIQLESDLREELTERDEQLCQAEENVQHLKETLVKQETQYKFEKEELNSKLFASEALYKQACDRTELKRTEMLEEIARLQSTIDELKHEIMSLSKVQAQCKLLENENSDLKNLVHQFQNKADVLEEEKCVLKSLQMLSEQAVQENVFLQSEVTRLKKKLDLMKIEIANDREEDDLGESEGVKSQSLKASKRTLMGQDEQLGHVERNFQNPHEIIEKLKSDHVGEKHLLKAKLSESEVLYKEMCDRSDVKRQEMLVEITRLQSTINELQNEITSLSHIQAEYMLIKKENVELRKVVSDLQNRSIILGDERAALQNLQSAHEQTVKENIGFLSEISELQEKLNMIERAYDELRIANKNPTTEKLQEDLDDRDKKLFQVEKKVQVLHETIEKLERDHKFEIEDLNSKCIQSEILHRNICDEVEKEREEIISLQSIIKNLKSEIASSCQIQGEYKLRDQNNFESKPEFPLQSSSLFLEDDKDVLRSLQNVHEQTVKENVRLLSEISRLQKKLISFEKKTSKDSVKDQLNDPEEEENQFGELVFQLQGEPEVQDLMYNKQHMETLENVNLKLLNKTKELEDTTDVLCKLEKGYRDVKNENDYLRTQMVVLQGKLNSLTLEYDHVKKAINLEEITLPELEEAPMTMPGLKLIFMAAKKENFQLQEKLKFMEHKNIEAVENNKLLSSEVSWLQKEIHNMEEMTEASLKLEQLYEDAKSENSELKALVQLMPENILRMERMHAVKSVCANKETQTSDRNSEIKSLQQNLNAKAHSPLDTTSPRHHLPRSGVENGHISPDQMGLECSSVSSANQYHSSSEDLSEIKKPMSKVEEHRNLRTVLYTRSSPDSAAEVETSPRLRGLKVKMEQKAEGSGWKNEVQKRLEHLRCKNKHLKEENAALVTQISTLREEGEVCNQKVAELLDACEEMWVNLETAQNEKLALEKMVDILTNQVAESKSRNDQLISEKEELYLKNSKNQEDLQDLNRRLMVFLKQKDRKDSAKGLEEWQKEKCQMSEEVEGYRSKISDSEAEMSRMKVQNHYLEQENAVLKQEVEAKQLSRCSEITDLKKEISLLINKNEKLLKEKETLEEELNTCVGKSARAGCLENKIASMKQEQKTLEQQLQALRSQVSLSQEKIQNLEENLQSVNIQLSRIKSDLRVAHQEKEALKQEVMSLHKQLQTANNKKQVLEMAMRSSGLQGQHKKQYWDDLEQLMEQEKQLLRKENERLQREVQNTKTDLAQSREKVRQLESSVISLKHQRQLSQSSLVKALEQEKSSLRRECEQLQRDLMSANRKISQLSAFERESETTKADNEDLRVKQGKFDDHITEMMHSANSTPHSTSQLQQQACATVPREQYLQLQQQLQQADRRNQQLQETMDHRSAENITPQSDQGQLLEKMEVRMLEVEQKLRIVKMFLQEKVNQLKEQVIRNTRADATIKDLYVENSQLLKALEMSEQRHQTAEKKNYLLEEKICGLSKIVRDLAPGDLGTVLSPQRKL